MRSGSAWVVMGLGAGFVLGGCHLVLGLDEYSLVEGTGGSGGGTSTPSCMDGKRNAEETDIDCGGGTCAACEDFKGCVVGADCKSSICTAGTCRPSECMDGVKNGDESDIDCGGSCGATCSPGDDCNGIADCESAICTSAKCVDYHLWSKSFGEMAVGVTSPAVSRVSVGKSGAITLAASYIGKMDFGGGTLTNVLSLTMAIGRFGADGSHLWSKSFDPTNGGIILHDLAVDADENIIAIGEFGGYFDIGQGAINEAGGGDIFLVKLDKDGNPLWGKAFGDGSQQAGQKVAIDSAGNIIIACTGGGTINFGGAPLMPTKDAIFVAKFTPTGDHVWSNLYQGTTFGNGTDLERIELAVDGPGNAFLAGTFSGTVDVGKGPMTSVGVSDIFVSKLGPTGNVLWAKQLGGPDPQKGVDVAVDGSNNVILVGSFETTVTLGGTQFVTKAAQSLFVVKLDLFGNHVWSKAFEGASTASWFGVNAVAAGPADSMTLMGTFVGNSLDFGGGPLHGTGNGDIFVAKLDNSGKHIWSRGFERAQGAQGDPVPTDLAVNADGLALTGFFIGTMNFGGSPLISSMMGGSLYLVKLHLP